MFTEIAYFGMSTWPWGVAAWTVGVYAPLARVRASSMSRETSGRFATASTVPVHFALGKNVVDISGEATC